MTHGAGTHYEVLGVAPTATAEQIRRAYYDAARRHHPDMHVGASADVMAEARRAMASVNAAWEILGDPARRRVYDDALRPAHRPEPPSSEEPAWIGEPDVDDTPPGLRAQSVVMLPVGLLAGAAGSFVFGMMSQIAAFLVIAFLLASVAGFGFVAAPLLTMRRRTARDRDPGPRS